jgi:hypothetical protein
MNLAFAVLDFNRFGYLELAVVTRCSILGCTFIRSVGEEILVLYLFFNLCKYLNQKQFSTHIYILIS